MIGSLTAVLERMRALREDIDADLAEMRSELVTLRQAVEDVGDRVQLRQLRSTVDDLRSDVAGLRRAVLEWPELERVSSDLAALRSDVGELLGRMIASEPDEGSSSQLDGILSTLRERPSLPTLAPVLEELAALRTEMSEVRSLSTPDVFAEELAGVRQGLSCFAAASRFGWTLVRRLMR